MKNIFQKLNPSIKSKLSKCQFLVMDFDGVLTDNQVYVDSKGKEMILCSRADGAGLSYLRKYSDVSTLILSSEKDSVVAARAMKLKTPYIHGLGLEGKIKVLKRELKARKVDPQEVCYVGNDLNDLECMNYVGLSIAASDSHPQVLSAADYVTLACGGHGAVREICELILYSKKSHPNP